MNTPEHRLAQRLCGDSLHPDEPECLHHGSIPRWGLSGGAKVYLSPVESAPWDGLHSPRLIVLTWQEKK